MPTADELLGVQVARDLLTCLRTAEPGRSFAEMGSACDHLTGLGLRQRVDLLAAAMLTDLPGGYAGLAAVVRHARDSAEAPLAGWMVWPVTVAVAQRAVHEGSNEAFDDAMALLASLTSRLSAEFALRLLLRADLDRALGIVQGWTQADDAHLRRLASEGTRPYLPWAVRVPRLLADPGATMPILDALYRDGSDYVRRSVANHLNDLSRDQPDLVVASAARWLDDPAPTTASLVRHGLRTLAKKGDPATLVLLGFTPGNLSVYDLRVLTPVISFPGMLRFTAVVRNEGREQARVAVDYVVHHLKANGMTTPKTFKLTTRTLAPGQELPIDRSHEFRPITTRRYYPGEHAVALQVNGRACDPVAFQLRVLG